MNNWAKPAGTLVLCLVSVWTIAMADPSVDESAEDGPAIIVADPASVYDAVFDRSGFRTVTGPGTGAGVDGESDIRLALRRYQPEARQPTPTKWSQGFYLAGAAADLYTTKRVLDDPRGVEANPLLAFSGDDFTVLASAAGFKVATYFAVRKLSRRGYISKRQASRFLNAFGAIQFGAAYYNRGQYYEARD